MSHQSNANEVPSNDLQNDLIDLIYSNIIKGSSVDVGLSNLALKSEAIKNVLILKILSTPEAKRQELFNNIRSDGADNDIIASVLLEAKRKYYEEINKIQSTHVANFIALKTFILTGTGNITEIKSSLPALNTQLSEQELSEITEALNNQSGWVNVARSGPTLLSDLFTLVARSGDLATPIWLGLINSNERIRSIINERIRFAIEQSPSIQKSIVDYIFGLSEEEKLKAIKEACRPGSALNIALKTSSEYEKLLNIQYGSKRAYDIYMFIKNRPSAGKNYSAILDLLKQNNFDEREKQTILTALNEDIKIPRSSGVVFRSGWRCVLDANVEIFVNLFKIISTTENATQQLINCFNENVFWTTGWQELASDDSKISLFTRLLAEMIVKDEATKSHFLQGLTDKAEQCLSAWSFLFSHLPASIQALQHLNALFPEQMYPQFKNWLDLARIKDKNGKLSPAYIKFVEQLSINKELHSLVGVQFIFDELFNNQDGFSITANQALMKNHELTDAVIQHILTLPVDKQQSVLEKACNVKTHAYRFLSRSASFSALIDLYYQSSELYTLVKLIQGNGDPAFYVSTQDIAKAKNWLQSNKLSDKQHDILFNALNVRNVKDGKNGFDRVLETAYADILPDLLKPVIDAEGISVLLSGQDKTGNTIFHNIAKKDSFLFDAFAKLIREKNDAKLLPLLHAGNREGFAPSVYMKKQPALSSSFSVKKNVQVAEQSSSVEEPLTREQKKEAIDKSIEEANAKLDAYFEKHKETALLQQQKRAPLKTTPVIQSVSALIADSGPIVVDLRHQRPVTSAYEVIDRRAEPPKEITIRVTDKAVPRKEVRQNKEEIYKNLSKMVKDPVTSTNVITDALCDAIDPNSVTGKELFKSNGLLSGFRFIQSTQARLTAGTLARVIELIEKTQIPSLTQSEQAAILISKLEAISATLKSRKDSQSIARLAKTIQYAERAKKALLAAEHAKELLSDADYERVINAEIISPAEKEWLKKNTQQDICLVDEISVVEDKSFNGEVQLRAELDSVKAQKDPEAKKKGLQVLGKKLIADKDNQGATLGLTPEVYADLRKQVVTELRNLKPAREQQGNNQHAFLPSSSENNISQQSVHDSSRRVAALA